MKLTYIYHSGFAIETNSCVIVMDFFKDTDALQKGVVYDKLLKTDKRLYVLSSHSHADHFNREILNWKDINKSVQFVFSKDILDAGMAKAEDAVFLDKLDIFSDEHISIQAFGSTDIGGSFLIKCEGKTIYHAGDLNNWHWDQESTPAEIHEAQSNYLKELNLLAQHVTCLDLVMFPVDIRLGKNYMIGAEQFIDKISVKLFAPMHFSKDYESPNALKNYAESKACRFFEIRDKGDSIEF